MDLSRCSTLLAFWDPFCQNSVNTRKRKTLRIFLLNSIVKEESHFTSINPVSTRLTRKAYGLNLASQGLIKAKIVENPTVRAKAFFPPSLWLTTVPKGILSTYP